MQILPVPGLEVRVDSTFKIYLKVHENYKEHLHRFKLNSSTRAETFTEICLLDLQLSVQWKLPIIPGHRAFQQASDVYQDLQKTQCHSSVEP